MNNNFNQHATKTGDDVNGHEMQSSSGTNIEIQPCFETSSAKIFTNLHNAAVLKAADVLGIDGNDKAINSFIINGGMSGDGRTKADKQHTVAFWKEDKCEMGIVLQVTEWQTPKDLDGGPEHQLQELMRTNDKAIREVKKRILDGINEYFRWFAGTDGDAYTEDDLVEFYPDYNGGKIQIDKGQIIGIDDKKIYEYLSHRSNTIKGKEGDNEGGNMKPRIGYKVGYNINYEKSTGKEGFDTSYMTNATH